MDKVEAAVKRFKSETLKTEDDVSSFVIPESTIYAHRNILSNGSLYFRRMLCVQSQEAAGAEFHVDCSLKALQVIVHFIYTNTIPSDAIETGTIELWAEVFAEALAMDVPELPGKAIWFSYCRMEPGEAVTVAEMCKKHRRAGFILDEVMGVLKAYFEN